MLISAAMAGFACSCYQQKGLIADIRCAQAFISALL
jgi:hypothetical protein